MTSEYLNDKIPVRGSCTMTIRKWLGLVIFTMLLTWARSTPLLYEDRPLVIAHRGASSLAPENTMAAVYAALNLGVDMVEVDVHSTLDGELVVIHDATVNRTSNGNGYVQRLTLEEIRELDAGSWFRRGFYQEKIPTLREVLEAVKDKSILLIELKEPDIEGRTIELVRELDASDQVILQSFDYVQIQKAKQLAPEIHTIFLVNRPNYGSEPIQAALWMLDIVQTVGASGLSVHYNWCTPELVSLAAERDVDVYVWTVNRRSKLRKSVTAGVKGIVTNKPQTLLSLF